MAKPVGPTCHTGKDSCFYNDTTNSLKYSNPTILNELFEIIDERKINPRNDSYTSKLFSGGKELISQKVIEELCELIVEYNSNDDHNPYGGDNNNNTLDFSSSMNQTVSDMNTQIGLLYKQKT